MCAAAYVHLQCNSREIKRMGRRKRKKESKGKTEKSIEGFFSSSPLTAHFPSLNKRSGIRASTISMLIITNNPPSHHTDCSLREGNTVDNEIHRCRMLDRNRIGSFPIQLSSTSESFDRHGEN